MLPGANKYKLVLVEDAEDDVLLFEMALKRTSLDQEFAIVQRFETGDAAIAYFTEGQSNANPTSWPDIVVLDLNLPGLNGFEIMEWMRGLKNPPIVAVFTTSQELEEHKRARALGAAVTEAKNFETDEFTRFMRGLGKLADERRQR